ncbi:glycosyltransferase [Nocardioides caldifontis]|uniref:glycosyltransferase n=1 Tax=Nocardioides caldifontis TaxID=2588938 RepID=UPI001396851B|nr:glycosyltransferase [Nocardioides caldifontis]
MTGRRITVVVGTDHHPFERAVRWADDWQRRHPEEQVTVQHGYTRAPEVAAGVELMAPDELSALLAASDVVVTHGGPGTIMGARNAGHHPLVLPRDPLHGEHVDGHQMHFAAWAAEKQLVQLVDTPERLDEEVDALGEAGTRVTRSEAEVTGASAQHLARLVDQLDRRRLPASPGATTVLYLAGADPTSTARVARLLQEQPPGAPLLHEGSLTELRGCSCGKPAAECAFWCDVRRLVEASGAPAADPLPLPTGRFRRDLTVLLAGRKRLTGSLRRDVLRYAAARRALYDAVREVTDAPYVVDAGPSAPPLVALSHDRMIDLRVLHVVRDVRTLAAAGPGSPGQVASRWVAQNAAVEVVRRRGVPVARLRHEELDADPAQALAAVLPALELPDAQDGSLGATPAAPWLDHVGAVDEPGSATGATGAARPLDRGELRRVNAVALPLLLKYGYPRSWM